MKYFRGLDVTSQRINPISLLTLRHTCGLSRALDSFVKFGGAIHSSLGAKCIQLPSRCYPCISKSHIKQLQTLI